MCVSHWVIIYTGRIQPEVTWYHPTRWKFYEHVGYISSVWGVEDNSDYGDFVKNQWKAMAVNGWCCGYVLKEKRRWMLKCKLKEWNRDHFGNLDQKIMAAKNELQGWVILWDAVYYGRNLTWHGWGKAILILKSFILVFKRGVKGIVS